MATLTVYTAPGAGTPPALTAASAAGGGDVIPNNGKTIVQITNGGGSSITATFAATGTLPSGASISSVAGTMAAGVTRVFGPFPTNEFNNSSGQVALTYSGVTSVTVLCISMP